MFPSWITGTALNLLSDIFFMSVNAVFTLKKSNSLCNKAKRTRQQ